MSQKEDFWLIGKVS